MAEASLADYWIGGRIARSQKPGTRKALLTFSLVLNFTFLGYFKYFNFFVDSFARMADVAGVHHLPLALVHIILPPAISFYTFQEVAYIVDVYYKRVEAANSLLDYALFISLFPHLIAGPIHRPSHLLPQVQKPRSWNAGNAFNGLLLILEGLLRKVVVADNCALIANAAFDGRLVGPNVVVLIL